MNGVVEGVGILFRIPDTNLVRVNYVREGTRYSAVISNPRTNQRLRAVMLARQVCMSQVEDVLAMPERSR